MGIDPKIRIADAIRIAGSKAALARMLGVHRSRITAWEIAGDHLPALHAYRFERIRENDETGEILYFDPVAGITTRIVDPSQPEFEL